MCVILGWCSCVRSFIYVILKNILPILYDTVFRISKKKNSSVLRIHPWMNSVILEHGTPYSGTDTHTNTSTYIFIPIPFPHFHDNDDNSQYDNIFWLERRHFTADCTICCLHKSWPKSLCSQAKVLHKRRSSAVL